MPNIPIVDLSVSCPSSCSLIGTASVMRNFLLLKNLPQVPTDIITAGLVNEWYNDGNVAPAYDNLDPQALIDIGNVLTDINNMRIKHKNLNLYDDYASDHYNNINNYTEYPLLSIDDSIAAVTMVPNGDIRDWVDSDDVLIPADTWNTKWEFELGTNKYQPGNVYLTSDPSQTLAGHTDYIILDANNPSVTSNMYTVLSFGVINTNNTVSNITYYETYLSVANRYLPINAGGYAESLFPVGNYIDYADPTTPTTVPTINPAHENVDQFSNQDGGNIGSYVLTPSGARDWFNTTYNDYFITQVYNPFGMSNSYLNTNAPLINNAYENNVLSDVNTSVISSVDGFILNLPDLSSLGFIEDTQILLNSTTMVGVYCDLFNIYGNNNGGTDYQQSVEIDTWKAFVNSQTAPGCFPYINALLSPDVYGIQTFKDVKNNALNILDDFISPQATINTYDGKPLNLTHFGITSDIQTSLGFVFPLMPVSFDAILSQLDTNLDTPLGNAAKRKLASEFFNKISLALRQEAYGKAEQIGEGFKNLVGNLASSLVGKDKPFENGVDTMLNAFRNFEITVPKSIIGRAANLVASLGGVNIKLDPISEPISWTANVSKEENVVEDLGYDEIVGDKRNFWNKLTGLGGKGDITDPSSILLAYTSNGQREFIRNSIKLNTYYPFYNLPGFTQDSATENTEKQGKKRRRLRKLESAQARVKKFQEKIIEIDQEIAEINKYPDGSYKNKIDRMRYNGAADQKPADEVIKKLIKKLEADQAKYLKKQKEAEDDVTKGNAVLREFQAELPYYPVVDDGSLDSGGDNSFIASRKDLRDKVDQSGSEIPTVAPDYAKTKINDIIGGEAKYEYPIDKSVRDRSRYRKWRADGLAPEPDDERKKITEEQAQADDSIFLEAGNIYYEVADLLKHGVNPLPFDGVDNRGLNIASLDGSAVGYNVYPVIPRLNGGGNKLTMPGLGREDQYNGQSLFSVLEGNGYVKISPLWTRDQIADTDKARDFVVKYNPDSDYVQMVTDIHRYMFSIENLAWKGFSQQLPWQERGPNGGRILWFPPYDLRITDTTTVAIGSENLIGRNEPVYTYNHSERSGVLSFKLLMDFPGYNDPEAKITPEPQQTPTVTPNPQPIYLDLKPPKDVIIPWSFDADTYLYIFLDGSGSMSSYSDAILNLFKDGGKLQKSLTDKNNGVYTQAQYEQKVFIFQDPGLEFNGDNIDDGRFFSWFASPYFMSQGIDSSNNTAYDIDGNPHTALPMAQRLKANMKYNTVANLPTTTPDKVICIALSNDASPAYIKYDDVTQTINIPPLGRLIPDLADYISAKGNYSEFTGVILGYDWNTGPLVKMYNDIFDIMNLVMFGGQANGLISTSGIHNTNNINIAYPASINWSLPSVTFDWAFVDGITAFGNYDIAAQTIDIGDLGDIKYQLEIGATGTDNISGVDSNDAASVTDIVYVIKKVLSTNNQLPSVTKKEEYTHDKLPLLREYITKMAYNHPSHALDVDPILIWDDDEAFIETNDVNIIIGGSAGPNKYDVELHKLFINGVNAESNLMRSLVGVMVQLPNGGAIISILQWLQDNGGGPENIKPDGTITSAGWATLMKILAPLDPLANTSVDPTGAPTATPQNTTANNATQWGIDINPNGDRYRNPLNEFMYFKRLQQTDKIYTDTIKEKIVYFDPAFHSVTPVGFNNRLNFLEQCARQGPSINNAQDTSGNFIMANSNLAFGRPPISVLRIGDFYHTRIVVEGVDLQYEPLIFDMNPEGIGVQPMIANVTINFKYIGGSSLSGPITQLQNAISNNYFANVEFYHTKALKAFERNTPAAIPQGNIAIDEGNNALSIGDGVVAYNFFSETNPDPQGETAGGGGTSNSGDPIKNSVDKNSNKTDNTKKCTVCPDGWNTLFKDPNFPNQAVYKCAGDVFAAISLQRPYVNVCREPNDSEKLKAATFANFQKTDIVENDVIVKQQGGGFTADDAQRSCIKKCNMSWRTMAREVYPYTEQLNQQNTGGSPI